MEDINLTSTFDDKRNLVTKTPLATGGGGLPADLIAQIIAARRPAAPPLSNLGGVRGGMPRQMQAPAMNNNSSPLSTGTEKSPTKYPTRVVPDPFESPYANYANPGASKRYVTERKIDGQWEFDGAAQGRGSSGGAGRIDTGTPTGGGLPPALDPRMLALVGQQNAANAPSGMRKK